MSILRKPYEISIWDDVWNSSSGTFEEQRLCVIGSDKMESQSRALEPSFSRNVNGCKRLSFKLYKTYTDNITGKRINNPFADYLISERKVKLKYDNEWHDFIVKNISEDSSNKLFVYQLEDALVQELSKNGFGVTLDERLMNNIGSAKNLAEKVLKETDWEIASDSEVFVEKIEEPLFYITIPSGVPLKHVLDQRKDNMGVGVTTEDHTFNQNVTGLAFYSCCVNKPYRFQFIYVPELSSITKDSESRCITNKNCQYYVDVDGIGLDYVEDADGYFLPEGFSMFIGTENGVSSKLSTLYRGKRYGFSQQSQYIPALDRYVNLYEKIPNKFEQLNICNCNSATAVTLTESNGWYSDTISGAWGGTRLLSGDENFTFSTEKKYRLTYEIQITNQTADNLVKKIGGHINSCNTCNYCIRKEGSSQKIAGSQYNSPDEFKDGFSTGDIYRVAVWFTTNGTGPTDGIYIQPNRGNEKNASYPISYRVRNIVLAEVGSSSDLASNTNLRYGYQDVEYKSPAFTQNLISNTKFENTSGWIGTKLENSGNKARIENVCGYFENGVFVNSLDQISSGTFPVSGKTYSSFLKCTMYAGSAIINSGPFDNRVLLNNILEDDEFALFYDIASAPQNNTLTFSLGEYNYSLSGDKYVKDESNLKFLPFSTKQGYDLSVNGKTYTISSLDASAPGEKYTEENFKKKSNVRLCLTSNLTGSGSITFYIKNIQLFKAAYTKDKKLITIDDQATDNTNKIIEKTYCYLSPSSLEGVTNPEQINPEYSSKTLDYFLYKPKFNNGAEKIRAVSAKESNYFNILQSIAETFEAWLLLRVKREDANAPGKITGKEICFKNYIGRDNFAGFKYGINLKNIQRTFESQNIVTKLMVKANNNKYAENGFCAISRANSNPTGEDSIYDFQYFHNKGLLNARDYLQTVYLPTSGVGPDMATYQNKNILYYSGTVGSTPSKPESFNNYKRKIQNQPENLLNNVLNKNQWAEYDSWTERDGAFRKNETTNENYIYFGQSNYPIALLSEKKYTISFDAKFSNNTKPFDVYILQQTFSDSGNNQNPYPFASTGLTTSSGVAVGNGYYHYSLSFTPNSLSRGIDKCLLRFDNNGKNNSSGDTAKLWIKNVALEEGKVDWYQLADETTTHYCIYTDGVAGDVLEYSSGNIQGYFPRLKALNKKASEISNLLINTNKDLTQYNAKKEVADAGLQAASSGIEEIREEFLQFVGVSIEQVSSISWDEVVLENSLVTDDDNPWGKIEYTAPAWLDKINGITISTLPATTPTITITGTAKDVDNDKDRSFYLTAYPILKEKHEGEVILELNKKYTILMVVKKGETVITGTVDAVIADFTRSDISRLLNEYSTYYMSAQNYSEDLTTAKRGVEATQKNVNLLSAELLMYNKQKQLLNQKFFSKYSRFIQEGTWISEEYVDDEKYYADAQSVMYNSCYPQVAYSINVLEVSQVPGYEMFTFRVGDKTLIEDAEFFGNEAAEVIITEVVESLDEPDKNQLKVQNFKNQFQDLFQKITATVQQAQYNTGSYEKAVALAEANQARKQQFLADALDAASTRLAIAGQQSVTTGADGITVYSVDSPCDSIRMVGGAILLSKQDKNGQQKWVTGVTSDGISASLITAGVLNAGEISIMNESEPAFRWDAYGLTSYGADWTQSDVGVIIDKINTKKFVRFDKNGLYGINSGDIDGSGWQPSDISDIISRATFALTWDGLFVRGNDGVQAKIGKDDTSDCIINIIKNGESVFTVSKDGAIKTTGMKIIRATGEDGSAIPSTDQVEASIQEATSGLAEDISDAFEDIYDSNKTTNETIDNINKKVGEYLGLGGTVLEGPDYVISPYIGGGYLNIANDNYSVTIDPKGLTPSSSVFQIEKTQIENGNKKTEKIMGIDASGNAYFKGTIEGSTFQNTDKSVYLSTTALTNQTLYKADDTTALGNNLSLIQKVGSHFGITSDGTLYAAAGQIGDIQIGEIPSKDYISKEISNEISNNNSTLQNSINATVNDLFNGVTGENLVVVKNNLLVIKDTGNTASHEVHQCTPSYSGNTLTLSVSNVSDGEIFYRFMAPGSSTNTFYSLDKNKKYIFSGEVKVKTNAGTLNSVSVRSESINKKEKDTLWYGGINQSIPNLEEDQWVKFSNELTIEKDATGYYFSLQIYYSGTLSGIYEFKNLELREKNYSKAQEAADLVLARYLSNGGKTTLGNDYVISPYIGGGYLNIANSDGTCAVVIDPSLKSQDKAVFSIQNNREVVLSMGANGQGHFRGRVDAEEGHFNKVNFGRAAENLFKNKSATQLIVGDSNLSANYSQAVFGGYPIRLWLPLPSDNGVSVYSSDGYDLRLEATVLQDTYGGYSSVKNNTEEVRILYEFSDPGQIKQNATKYNQSEASGQEIAGGLRSGTKYRVKGKASIQHADWSNTPLLRSEWQYAVEVNGEDWFDNLSLDCYVLKKDASAFYKINKKIIGYQDDKGIESKVVDRKNESYSHENFKEFELEFEIPSEAVGAYFALEINRDSLKNPYVGEVLIKDLKINELQGYQGEISDESGLTIWSGEKNDNSKIFQLSDAGISVGQIKYDNDLSTISIREPVYGRHSQIYVYDGDPIKITEITLESLNSNLRIKRIGGQEVSSLFNDPSVSSDGGVSYTVRQNIEFIFVPGQTIIYSESASEQTGLEIIGHKVTSGTFSVNKFGQFYYCGHSFTSVIRGLVCDLLEII